MSNFVQTAIDRFKQNFNKFKQTTKMSQTTTALKTVLTDVENVGSSAIKDIKYEYNKIDSVVTTDYNKTVGWIEKELVLSTEGVIGDIKAKIADLESIATAHIKAKAANTDKINKLNVSNAQQVAALQASNVSHDTEIQSAQTLAQKLTPLVSTVTTSPATVTVAS